MGDCVRSKSGLEKGEPPSDKLDGSKPMMEASGRGAHWQFMP